MTAFFRFPHTPHIAWLGDGAPRDDKLLSPDEAQALLDGPVVVEEKLDGANLGFSLAPDGSIRAQNRGDYLAPPYTGQFSRLGAWLAAHEERLFDALDETLIVFGEWCAARHTLDYASLPDWWLMFDVYDRGPRRFWSTARRDALAAAAGLCSVPILHRGHATLAELTRRVAKDRSGFRAGGPEGVVIRREDPDWLQDRAKLVRAEFAQAIEAHWRKRPLEWNRLA